VKTIQHWIDGSPVPGAPGTDTTPVFDPATGAEQARVVLGGTAEVDAAVTAAARAFETWSESSLTRRTQVMFAVRQLLVDHEEELEPVLGEAVKRGVCVSPPAGVPKPADAVAELARLDAELCVIVEQDLYPCVPTVPLPIAVSTREHLAGCGPTGTRRPNPNR
jgi:hypothetical protein